jgi:ankyrin repeat protein
MSHEELTSKIADSFQEFSNMLSQLSSCKSNIAPSPMTPPLVPPVVHPKSVPRRQACNHAEPPLSPPTAIIGQNQSKGQPKGKVRAKETLRKEENDSNSGDSNIISSNSSSSTSSIGRHNNNNEDPTCFEKVNVLLLNGMHNAESEQPHHVIAKCLTIAASNGRADILERMLGRNVDLNCTDNEASGITPLMYAAYFGRINCLHLLLQHSSIKVNKQDKSNTRILLLKKRNTE